MEALDLARQMGPLNLVRNAGRHAGVVLDAAAVKNARVLRSLLGPALRGFLFQKGKHGRAASIPTEYEAYFTFDYNSDNDALSRLYKQAKRDQWDGETLPWDTEVDPHREDVRILNWTILPMAEIPGFNRLSPREKHI